METLTPRFVSMLIFGAAAPHAALMYPMLWADPLSDEFFRLFELGFGWVTVLNTLESSAGVALGYIDY